MENDAINTAGEPLRGNAPVQAASTTVHTVLPYTAEASYGRMPFPPLEATIGSEESVPALSGEDSARSEEPELIFALDIGTRSVIGIVGVPDKGMLRVLAVEEQQHTRRAVIDGQIEDIGQTALVAQNVKERLEQKVGRPLRDVCIAAAGRALKTQLAEFEMELDEKETILDKQILELETGAIQQAYSQLESDSATGEPLDFLCVGHSVVSYWLDGYEMSTLLDHRGKRAKVRIIATFLPSEVVESLYAVTVKVGLTVTSVTLEPIAAMNAVIPRELRMLNLALVDVGGGTSDIAISNSGSVVAYTMATTAGDEITECIMRECLVDFDTAEEIKLEFGKRPGQIPYRDILGFHYEMSDAELEQKIRPAIDELADEIANRILEANGKAPAAVFLVGGGCQLPMLCGMLAGRLSIDEKKVAVGGSNYMKRMVSTETDISAPEFATPVGIALTAMSNRLEKGLAVSINGKKVTLLKNGTSTVLELLLLSGCQYSQIMGRSGSSVIYELNGERKSVRGEHSIPAEVRVNGLAASVSTPVRPDDQIEFRPAYSGADAAPTIRSEIGEFRTVHFCLAGREQDFQTEVLLNGSLARPDQRIQNGDRVQIVEEPSIEGICRRLALSPEQFRYIVNGEEQDIEVPLRDGDFVEAIPDGVDTYSEYRPEVRSSGYENGATASSYGREPVHTPDARFLPGEPDWRFQVHPQTVHAAEPVREVRATEIPVVPSRPVAYSQEYARPEPLRPEPMKSEPTKSEPTKSEPTKSEPTKSEPTKSEPTKLESNQLQSIELESTRPEPIKQHTVRLDPVRPEPVRSEPVLQEPVRQAPSTPKSRQWESVHPAYEVQNKVIRVTLNDHIVELYPKEDGSPYQFVDMLNFVDIDPSKPQGNIILRLNGRNASYLDVVREGDQVDIQWDRQPKR